MTDADEIALRGRIAGLEHAIATVISQRIFEVTEAGHTPTAHALAVEFGEGLVGSVIEGRYDLAYKAAMLEALRDLASAVLDNAQTFDVLFPHAGRGDDAGGEG